MAVPNYVEESDSGNLGSALTPIAHTIPSGWSVGDLAIALVSCAANRSISGVPSGWTVIGAEQATALCRLNAYWKILESGDINASHAWTPNASSFDSNQVVFIRLSAHDVTTPVNTQAGSAEGSSSTTHENPSVTTGVSDCLILRIMAVNLLLTASSGDTGTDELQNYRIRIFRSSKASAGATGTATYTTGNNTANAHKTIAIAPAGGGPAPPINTRLIGGCLVGNSRFIGGGLVRG